MDKGGCGNQDWVKPEDGELAVLGLSRCSRKWHLAGQVLDRSPKQTAERAQIFEPARVDSNPTLPSVNLGLWTNYLL